jgi:hypothetical protein
MHVEESAGSENSVTLPNEKDGVAGAPGASEHLQAITAVVRVGTDNYYEKDEPRTYGDGEDHNHEPPVFSQILQIQDLRLTMVLDDSPPNHVSYCYGCKHHSFLVLPSIALTPLRFLWTSSQCPLYLFGQFSSNLPIAHSCGMNIVQNDIGLILTKTGGVPPYIYGDIGGVDRWVWLVLANLLALAAVCPFVGALSDLFGRRYVALSGAGFVVIGMIICATAYKMNIFIGISLSSI